MHVLPGREHMCYVKPQRPQTKDEILTSVFDVVGKS